MPELRTGQAEPLDPECTAPRHGTRHARAYWSCICQAVYPTRLCRRCELERFIHCRGLCQRCYLDARRVGEVELYPRTGPWSPRSEVDPIAVERAAAGDPPAELTPWERREAIRRLDRNRTARAIAERLGVTVRTVVRHRAALRREAVAA